MMPNSDAFCIACSLLCTLITLSHIRNDAHIGFIFTAALAASFTLFLGLT